MLSSSVPIARRLFLAALCYAAAFPFNASLGASQENKENSVSAQPSRTQRKPSSLSPDEELQKAIDDASNDRAALAHNLEAYLQKYPESPQRPRIYRALVEADIQLHETSRAADYAERIVALTPTDVSMTLLAIQLLELGGDQAAMRRAVSYASRVLDIAERTSPVNKSPRLSPAEWEKEKQRDIISFLFLRGRLETKLGDSSAARKDFEASYALLPNASSAEELGEIAELQQDLNLAITEYARAFALAETSDGSPGRREIRQKLGNVWRLAHGTDDGLGDFLLRIYDETNRAVGGVPAKKNPSAKEPDEFTLRKEPDETPFPLAALKGTILVLDFWTTWCGPCRAFAPRFDRLGAQFQQNTAVLFLAVDCDEDETLVAAYLKEEKPKTTVVFADGLDRFLGVTAFPTLMVLDGSGKIAYRSDGFDPDTVEQEVSVAIRRLIAFDPAKK